MRAESEKELIAPHTALELLIMNIHAGQLVLTHETAMVE
ncbi:hypothetical protein Xszus_03943 [Xenorhabdus szentirmaii]|uniref:Uncharacterized protein n=1 Tax=Xenorhabdus szentirmaii DSM 16338 TaxID=1427518 RepID=W1J477_9GAMM|nr:hypothetical protein Xsze_01784 [Xenorhabdus szentirmaii DSM 16338]PHM44119.1 hypothetical protein Xszus_03943 [Xenorhabdus szentirmaii]CDL85562.1 hypothetical protein XSR1_80062 [Xenorhabdus szentirmaii DSM 16338]